MTPQAINKVSAGQGQAVEAREGAGPSRGGDNLRRPFRRNNAESGLRGLQAQESICVKLSELEPWGQH